MKAIIRIKSGKELSNMKVQEITSETVKANQIKVKMTSSRINPVDIDLMKGMPGLKYKNPQIGGIDGAGTIIEVGANISPFQVGDEVYFYRKFSDIGTWAEEIVVNASDAAKIPINVSLQDAGAIALPLLTAFDSLQQLGAQAGERILIHGAGGGVGFCAVQVAKQMGLKVIANGSSRDFESLQSVGVDQCINYKNEDFSKVLATQKVDYVFDVIGGDTLLKSIQLKPKKVISVAYTEVEKLSNTGLYFPGILKWIIKIMMGKFRRAAQKNGVELIGQVTAPNGLLFQQASDLVGQMDFKVKPYQKRTLSDIEQNGLSKSDLGKIICF